MDPVTKEDRRRELRSLLALMEAHPEREWSEARERVGVLREMLEKRERSQA